MDFAKLKDGVLALSSFLVGHAAWLAATIYCIWVAIGPDRAHSLLQGRGCLMRFADDCVIGCALKADAHRMMAVLPKRFARYGLTIDPTKTALIAFSKPEAPQGATEGNGTCDFLGLTHDWTRSRRGDWVIKRRTAQKRLRRTKKSLWRWCRDNRHTPLHYQSQQLGQQLRGHCQYDGIGGNVRLLEEVRSGKGVAILAQPSQ